ncbi:putative protein kinase [Trypanosoma cruzi]|uniref:Protein kinase, putative n=2 Tax=Trypanosoma cruzi TaxID=5693 RepID=Q4DCQ6_TRYCC|nr:protein kinase, putative [Trypanosoma cruzi]EAN90304.1 protein kinase, putative [Trypanosoma cruzi]PWV15163.1 putative protein kinase [Trypanosoma cruzi]|eukprot:XP_812155.1 protein kinase [Trypanosoma cruzi strain CL Brener]
MGKEKRGEKHMRKQLEESSVAANHGGTVIPGENVDGRDALSRTQETQRIVVDTPVSLQSSSNVDNTSSVMPSTVRVPRRSEDKVTSAAKTRHIDPLSASDHLFRGKECHTNSFALPSVLSEEHTEKELLCHYPYHREGSLNQSYGGPKKGDSSVFMPPMSNDPHTSLGSLSGITAPRIRDRETGKLHDTEEHCVVKRKNSKRENQKLTCMTHGLKPFCMKQSDLTLALSDCAKKTADVAETSKKTAAQALNLRTTECCNDEASFECLGISLLPSQHENSSRASVPPRSPHLESINTLGYEMSPIPREQEETGRRKLRKKHFYCCFQELPLSSVLIPYFLVLMCLSLFCLLTPYYVTTVIIRESVEEFHEHARLEINSQLEGALNVPTLLSSVFVALYVVDERNPRPNDDVIPMGFEMSQRFCAALHNMDRYKFLTFIYMASLPRDEIAHCARGFHGYYFATAVRRKSDGALNALVAVDPENVTLVEPQLVLKKFSKPFLLKDLIYNFTPTKKLIDSWKKDVIAGNEPRMQMWNVENFLSPRYVYTYPFFEKDGTVSFLKVALDLRRVLGKIFMEESDPISLVRVALLENDGNDSNMTVIATNFNVKWQGESGEGEFEFVFTQGGNGGVRTIGKAGEYMVPSPKVGNIKDPLMREAFLHVNMNEVMSIVRSGRKFFTTFPYDGSVGTFSVCLTQSELNATMVLAVVAPPFYGERFEILHVVSLIGAFISTIGATLLVYFVFSTLVSRPLHSIAAELRVTAKVDVTLARTSINTPRIRGIRFALLEIDKLQSVAASLKNQMRHLRSFLPEGVLPLRYATDEERKAKYMDGGIQSETRDADMRDSVEGAQASSPNLMCGKGMDIARSLLQGPRENINVFEEIMCSVVSVHILDIKTILEHTGETANIVVEAARKYGGGVDVFLPELFNLNFPCRGDSHLDKLDATFCAIEIHRNLPDAVRRCCAILVDSGVFHFGICGGPEKKEPVLWGRATSTELIHVQRRYGVSLAILQNTVPFIRSRVHVLPFASVLVDSADMSSKVTFHIVIEDIVNEGSWQCVEETYLNGFRYLTAQACTEARMCFESLVASPYVTPQLMRLLRCQIAQVQQCDVKKRSRFPSGWRVGGSDHVDTLTSKFSPASVDHSESIVSGLHPPSLTFCGSRRRLTPSALSTSASSTHVSSAGQAIAHEFWDKKNVRWKRASENFPESGRFPVFLGISDTGTLAALKFLPVSSLPDCGYNDMDSLDLALTRAQTLYHENLVQLLGYGQTKEHMCLIMEYVPGGTLRDTVRRYGRALPLMAIKRFLVGILRGLEYLHNRGLVHGNLRPEDVMAAVEGLYKLRGVSMACTAEAAAAMTEERLRAESCLNRWAYSSPEVFTTGKKGAAADIYAVGVILLELITNQTPWRWMEGTITRPLQNISPAEDDNIRQQNTKKTLVELTAILSDYDRMKVAQMERKISLVEIPREGDALIQEVLQSCLVTDPEGRKTASELLQLLSSMQ